MKSFKKRFIASLVPLILFYMPVELRAQGTSNYVTSRDVILPDAGLLATVPAKGETRTDPTTGVKITRMTNVNEINSNNNTNLKHALTPYSRYSPENTNGDLFIAFGSNSSSSWVVNRQTQQIVTRLVKHSGQPSDSNSIGESHEIRWDITGNHPYRIYYKDGLKFYMIDDVRNQQATRIEIRDFTSIVPNPNKPNLKLTNRLEGGSSNDGNHWAWMITYEVSTVNVSAVEPVAGTFLQAFVHYDVANNQVHTMVPGDLAGSGLQALITGPNNNFKRIPNMVEVNPEGTGIVIHYSNVGGAINNTWFDGPHLWPLNFDYNNTTPLKISIASTHSGWAYDESGQEMFISQNNVDDWLDAVATSGSNSGYNNRVQIEEHSSFGFKNGFHYGKVLTNRKGWALVSSYDIKNIAVRDNFGNLISQYPSPSYRQAWGNDQLMMIQVKPSSDNPIVWRIGPTYNLFDIKENLGPNYPNTNYRAEAAAAINSQGNRIYVSSNWDGKLDHLEVFMFELPDNWDSVLNGDVVTEDTYTGDFNGDGQSDILRRDITTGENFVDVMNNGLINNTVVINTVNNFDWSVVGTGDFNGDGPDDILWRNSATGQNVIYTMNSSSLIGSTAVINTVNNFDWGVVGTGDFNGDGQDDILWRNSATGQNVVYIMSNGVIGSTAVINVVNNSNWKVVGTGDFNGDGQDDILWRNSATGQNAVYTMSNGAIGSTAVINTISSFDWNIVATGDFNGDSQDDILWRNSVSGDNVTYTMNNGIISSTALINNVSNFDWNVVDTGDFNGDGRDDILWLNSANGNYVTYTMDNNGWIGSTALINP